MGNFILGLVIGMVVGVWLCRRHHQVVDDAEEIGYEAGNIPSEEKDGGKED